MKLTIEDVRSRFLKHFDGATGSVYASPGRINLIGEHQRYSVPMMLSDPPHHPEKTPRNLSNQLNRHVPYASHSA